MYTLCPIIEVWGIIWLSIDRSPLLRKVPDRQLMSESINFNSISNMIYGISSMIYGIGASIDISVRSVLRESRPGFPARGHDSESKRPLFGCICNACSNNTLWEESGIIMHQVHVLSLEICGSISVLANFEPPLSSFPSALAQYASLCPKNKMLSMSA